MAAKKKARPKGGRPSLYKPEFVAKARQLCLLGATDAQVADFFEVSVPTIDKWKQSKPEFLQALKDGKEHADAKVAHSLYRRALGYQHKAVKIFADPKTGSEHVVSYTERYPPDTTAAIFWLKNRQPGHWRDKMEQEVTGPGGGPLEVRSVVMLPPLIDQA